MAEPDKQQFGDGSDQWGDAARNLTNAAKELGERRARSMQRLLEQPLPPPILPPP